jgi:hypothetical protein
MKPPVLPIHVGWKETLDLPDWGVRDILVKIDTGARGSAIDAKNVRDLGDGTVAFEIQLRRKDPHATKTVIAPIVSRTRIRSSNGKTSERFVVRTTILMGKLRQSVDLSLVCRKRMICRMLLGRKALAGSCLVDAGAKYLCGKRRRTSIANDS